MSSNTMSRRRHDHGFTLLELLVVLAGLATVLAVAAPRFGGALAGPRLEASAREIAASLRDARDRAVTTSREVAFVVDLEGRRYRLGEDGRNRQLRGSPRITLETAAREQIDRASGSIRFFPDGSASGGRITLAQDGRSFHIDVDWLSGRVRLRD